MLFCSQVFPAAAAAAMLVVTLIFIENKKKEHGQNHCFFASGAEWRLVRQGRIRIKSRKKQLLLTMQGLQTISHHYDKIYYQHYDDRVSSAFQEGKGSQR